MEMICEDNVVLPPAAASSNNNTSNNNNKRPPSTPPSMELISDESSLDDSIGSSRSKRSCMNHNKKKQVSWDQIHTREYALVVGDHPMCQDGLPVSLGWDHADCNSIKLMMMQQQQQQQAEQQQLSERRQSYTFPRRLSYEERRDRLLSVSNLTLDQIKNDEIDLVVRTLRESWEHVDGNVILQEEANSIIGDDSLMGQHDDPLLADMMGLDDFLLPGMMALEDDGDLGDISNFEWTEDDTARAKEESSKKSDEGNNLPKQGNDESDRVK